MSGGQHNPHGGYNHHNYYNQQQPQHHHHHHHHHQPQPQPQQPQHPQQFPQGYSAAYSSLDHSHRNSQSYGHVAPQTQPAYGNFTNQADTFAFDHNLGALTPTFDSSGADPGSRGGNGSGDGDGSGLAAAYSTSGYPAHPQSAHSSFSGSGGGGGVYPGSVPSGAHNPQQQQQQQYTAHQQHLQQQQQQQLYQQQQQHQAQLQRQVHFQQQQHHRLQVPPQSLQYEPQQQSPQLSLQPQQLPEQPQSYAAHTLDPQQAFFKQEQQVLSLSISNEATPPLGPLHQAQAPSPTKKLKVTLRRSTASNAAGQQQAQAQLQVKPEQSPTHPENSTMPTTRRAGRSSRGCSRGADNHMADEDDAPATPAGGRSLRGRRAVASYAEDNEDENFEDAPGSDAEDDGDGEVDDADAEAEAEADGDDNYGNGNDANEAEVEVEAEAEEEDERDAPRTMRTRSGRAVKADFKEPADSDDSDEIRPCVRTRAKTSATLGGFVAHDDDDEDEDGEAEYGGRKRSLRLRKGNSKIEEIAAKKRARQQANGRGSRASSKRRRDKVDDVDFDDDETPEEQIASGEEDPNDLQSDEPEGSQARAYKLRERKSINYSLFAPPASPPRDGFGRPIKPRGKTRGGAGGAYEIAPPVAGGLPTMPFRGPGGRGKKGKEGWDAMPLSMTGKDYAAAFGDPIDSSDEELQQNAMGKPGNSASMFGGLIGAGGVTGGGGGAAGSAAGGLPDSRGTDSFGRIKKGDQLADIDPLGVDMNINFDSVGGLDHHIQQLKEMVTLPLLYPELFQRFKVTPPRGVLFHGPPGTGKTLVARALASSCSTDGQQISFFMRKGADCLSKWVGEAERQLRLLFEEARNAQPSIIFFDEIDGLAPVRSSKQDQIHASIVSTMLALMDGMDGRGQVVVIGATNRPDSVDPALRRPGRFDREFYFPLPNKEARKSIIDIQTRKWEPPLEDSFKLKLAEVTKGYGGADLRALCTEAALNAIQRRYPQIYQTIDRLLLDPESIQVDAKDFMMSVNKLVPSSARSTASAAAPLAERLKPLLGDTVREAITALDRVLPPVSKRNPLEEALWEEDSFEAPKGTSLIAGSSMLEGDRGFGREMLLQSFEAQRVFRPRMLIHGDVGMGQAAVGTALLQHLEGYHVQSLDIGTLMGDSARTPEAAVVQLFVEAKRHKPSVIFIPGLVHWADSMSDSVKTTFRALLDELAPSDPILLLAIAEAPLSQLSRDVKSWFGYLRDNKTEISMPGPDQRRAYFQEILDHVVRPPREFPDALPRRRKVLEELSKAPPRAPRQLTEAELQQQAENDAKLLEHLKYRLGPVLTELRKKHKKFTREVYEEYDMKWLTSMFEYERKQGKWVVNIRYDKPVVAEHITERSSALLEGAAATAMTAIATTTADQSADETLRPGEGQSTSANGASGVEVEADVSMEQAALSLGGSLPLAQPLESDGLPQADALPPNDESSTVQSETLPPPSQQANGVAGAVHPSAEASHGATEADAIAFEGDQSTASAPAAAAAEDDNRYIFVKRTFWTVNLEKMQKRLYYNGYLSYDAFMEDINKIVSTAEEGDERDKDRTFRAHQMRNQAIVLLDQYIDQGFRADCDRMAQRHAQRQAKIQADKKEAEEKKAEAERAAADVRKGERQSARVLGLEPEMNGSIIERGGVGKRARSESKQPEEGATSEFADRGGGGGDANGDVTMGDETRKRVRIDESSLNVDAIDEPTHGSTSSETNTLLPPTGSPPPPSFTYDAEGVKSLSRYILDKSANFNIEQLEQLRAAAFDRVWKRRSDWDRDALVHELRQLVDQVSLAVQDEINERKQDEAALLAV